MLDAVVFDFGGTLFHGNDDVEAIIDARFRTLRELGYEIDRETFDELSRATNERFGDRYHGDYRGFELGRYSELFFDTWGRDAPADHLERLDRVFWETRLVRESLDEDAPPVLRHCRDRDLFVGAITNGNELMTEHRVEALDATLDASDPFDLVLSSTGVEAVNSTVEPFETFLDRTGFDARDCLMVGDRTDEDT